MDSIRIIQHNVLSWGRRKWELTNIYMTLNPDIILINSHGIRNNKNIKIAGYRTYQINTSNELNDGSAILIKQYLNHRLDDTFITDVLSIKLYTTTGPINIATTYLPPRRPYVPYPDIHKLLYNTDPTYIVADLNAKHVIFGDRTNNEVGKGLERFHSNNKLIHLGPEFATYIGANTATTPDLILANNKIYHNHKIELGPLTSSDHLPIIFNITCKALTEPCPIRLLTGNTNWDLFRRTVEEELQTDSDNEEEAIEKVDDMLNSWYRAIKKSIDMNIPKTSIKIVRNAITNRKLKMMQLQFQRLYAVARIGGWTRQALLAYRFLRLQITIEAREQQEREWEREIAALTHSYKDPKNFWKKIKTIKGNVNPQPPYIIDNNRKIGNNSEKEEVFREIWKRVFRISDEENMDFDMNTEHMVHEYLRTNMDRTLPFDDININRFNDSDLITSSIKVWEIKQIIKNMKNNAPGYSGINKKIISELPEIAFIKLVDILNAALSLGYYPDLFKVGIIHLIPKGNKSPLNPNNYRPISLLEVPGKILERTINKRLKKHLTDNNLLPPQQHGFRENRGTNTAIALTSEIVAQNLSQRHQCHIVLRDVTKAFDKVWHEGLKYKILQLNLPGHLERVLCDYISDRTAKIRMNNIMGPEFDIKSGVPQGGILSPTLYTIYTRDIPDPSVDCYNILYADDITQIICHRGKSRTMMARKVGTEIEKINYYEKQWKIRTNQTKFTLIPLATKKNEAVIAAGELIEFSNEGRILGMKITTTGYRAHIKEIEARGKKALGDLFKLNNLPIHIKLHLVKAFVLPIIEYPAIPLVSMNTTNIRKLQRVQNKALRFAFNERYPYTRNTRQLHEEGHVKPLNTKLHERAKRTWEKLEGLDDPIYNTISEYTINKEHAWFPSSIYTLNRNEPQPIYT